MPTLEPWKQKVNRTIYRLCQAEYLRANLLPNGQMRKKHVPYTVPDEAKALIDCLNKNDEHQAKTLLMHDYKTEKFANQKKENQK